jgi:hypothetical protein
MLRAGHNKKVKFTKNDRINRILQQEKEGRERNQGYQSLAMSDKH